MGGIPEEIYVASGSPTVAYCDVNGGYTGEENIDADPMFVDPANNDYHLQAGSLCIDAGADFIPTIPETDFEGEARIFDGDNDGTARADMGADEHVDEDGDGLADVEEISTYGTNPNDPDSDDDGLTDGAEVNTHFTEPLKRDTDGDGYNDGREVNQGTNPLDPNEHPLQISDAERNALINLYNSTNGDGWTNKTGWKTPEGVFSEMGTECSWYGVLCGGTPTHTYVAQITLSANNLVGQIPASLGNLANLQRLRLDHNELSGSIPDLSKLTNLQVLHLNNNELSGSIPDLSTLTNLLYLGLNNNELSGSIPDLSKLTNLLYLALDINDLSGSIPDLSTLTNLQRLYLNNNQLNGQIPTTLQNLTNLVTGMINLSYNALCTTDSDLIAFLDAKQAIWEGTQATPIELCNGVDDDCNDVIDESCSVDGIDHAVEESNPEAVVTITDENGDGDGILELEEGETLEIQIETPTANTVTVDNITQPQFSATVLPPTVESHDEFSMSDYEKAKAVAAAGYSEETVAETIDIVEFDSSQLTDYLGTGDYDLVFQVQTALTESSELCEAELKQNAIILFCDGDYDLAWGTCTDTLVSINNRCPDSCTNADPIPNPTIEDICYEPISRDPDVLEVRNIPHGTVIISIVMVDSDGDGVPDDMDSCPGSNIEATIIIDSCDSGVRNHVFEDGCTMADLIAECADGAKKHGKFVSCVDHLANYWKKEGLIRGKEKDAIESCAAQADIP